MNGIDWTEIRAAQLINALASTVGLDQSRAAVEHAAATLGIATEVLSAEQAREVLDLIAKNEGMLGITSRFVRVRIDCGRPLPSVPPPRPPDSVLPPSSPRISLVEIDPADHAPKPVMATVFSRRLLISLLTGTLGRGLADESVHQMARELGLPDGEMTREQALSLLDGLAERAGKVGVTARFAKARLLLKESG